MDKDNVVFKAPAATGGNTIKWVFRILAVLAVVASTALSVVILRPPAPAVDFADIAQTEDIKEDTVYRFDKLNVSGIFMYMADSEQSGVPRNSGDGVFIEKEYVYAYHTLALADMKDGGVCVMIFSVKNTDGEAFDAIAEHDAAENADGDPGNSFPISVYAKAKKLGSDAAKAFEETIEEHKNTPGADGVKWIFCEMEYYLDGDENYVNAATAERREWLKLSLGLLPLAAMFFVLSLVPYKKSATNLEEESRNGVIDHGDM